MESQFPKDRYFFQLIPINLNRISKKGKPKTNTNSEIKFALFLQSHKVAQTKQWMQLQFTKNTFKCKISSLDFYIANFNSDFYTNFTLKVIVRQPPKLNYESDSEFDQICRVEEVINQLGFFQLDPGVYIETFNDDRKALFQENIEISKQYSLDYELYIERTRFRLEKVIRESRGINNEANLLALAFKKHTGKKKIRYVELDESRERSVKEQDFKKTKKTLISSLKRNGKKYIPQKTVQPDSNSSRNMTPLKGGKNISTKTNSHLSHQTPYLKINTKTLQLNNINEASKEQSNVQPPKVTRQAAFDRTFINPHSSFDTSLIANRINFDRCLQKTVLGIFWLVALFLLYLSMGPSKKI